MKHPLGLNHKLPKSGAPSSRYNDLTIGKAQSPATLPKDLDKAGSKKSKK